MMNIKSPRSIIILAIVFGLTFVALDILIDVTFFYNESFPENILSNKGELVFRILFLSCFLFFGAFIFEVFRKQKAMQNALIQTNRAAEDERAKLKAVLDNLGVGVIIQGLDYKVQYENRFQQESFGNHVGEICYKAYEGLDDLCPHCPMVHSLEDGQTHTVEVSVPFNGDQRHVQLISSPLKDSSGEIIAGIKVVKDITDIRQSEERSKQAQKNLENILEATPYGVVIIDRDKTIVHANMTALNLMGYETVGDVAGRLCHETLCPAEADQCPILDLGQEVDRSEKLLVTRDGERIPILKTVVPIMLDNEELLLEAFVDISKLKKAESFIKDILESVDEAFLVIDRDYRIISANRAFCQQVKETHDAVMGRFCYEVSHKYNRPCHEEGEDCPVKHTFESGEPYSSTHVHHDSTHHPLFMEIKAYPMRDASGRIVSAIETINDVTDKRKLEEQVRHSQKMEAIGTLTGGIAHDFNNILTAVIGYGEFLLESTPPDSQLHAYADMIVSSGQRGAKLTQSLLAFSRKQIIHPSPLELNSLITNLHRLLVRLIGEDIEIQTHLTDEPLTIMADSLHMEQVLMNLATNARDAMPDGGKFIIATEALDLDEQFVKAHGLQKPGRHALITVSDTGRGMDDETIQQVFEPFFTTKDVGKGTGLGLSVVYGIISQHNGNISIYSEPGAGTTLKIYLPLVEKPSLKSPDIPVSRRSEAPATGTILLAEDDPAVRKLIRDILQSTGYAILEATNGEEALGQFRDHAEEIDLLLLDVVMPQKSGLEVFREIQERGATPKTLFISGYPRDVIKEKGLLPEGVYLIQKPVSPSSLLEAIRNAMQENSPA